MCFDESIPGCSVEPISPHCLVHLRVPSSEGSLVSPRKACQSSLSLLFTLRALSPPDSLSCMSPVHPVPSTGCELPVARATGSVGPAATQSRCAGSPRSPSLGGDGRAWPHAPSQVTLLTALSGLGRSLETTEAVIAVFCLLPKDGSCLLTQVKPRSPNALQPPP